MTAQSDDWPLRDQAREAVRTAEAGEQVASRTWMECAAAAVYEEWHCTTDGVMEPCGDCDGCRYDESLRRFREANSG